MMQRFCLPELGFPPHFLKIVVEVKASGLPHVSQLWLGVSNDMRLVEYYRSTYPHVVWGQQRYATCRILSLHTSSCSWGSTRECSLYNTIAPHILMWFGVSKGMLPVEYYRFTRLHVVGGQQGNALCVILSLHTCSCGLGSARLCSL